MIKPNYTFIDFETTGLEYTENQVIEVGAVKYDSDLEPLETYHTMVKLNEGQELSDFIKNLTGIKEEDLEDGITEQGALKQLKTFIGDSIVVAQFASFDLGYLSKVHKPEYFICTRSMAQLLRPNEKASLKDLVVRYGVELNDAHRAFADVQATAEVFRYLLAECEEKGIGYMNVLTETSQRPLRYVPEEAIVVQL
jgi:DNA polymerase III subunit epsilon